MRTYLKTHGVNASESQLCMLVPAFDIAWDRLMRRRFPSQSERFLREDLAAAVVDLVLARRMKEPGTIAAAAVYRIEQTWTV